jgi:hypothetical protein
MSVVREALQEGMSDLIGQGLEVHSTASLLTNRGYVFHSNPIMRVFYEVGAQLLLLLFQSFDLLPHISQAISRMSVAFLHVVVSLQGIKNYRQNRGENWDPMSHICLMIATHLEPDLSHAAVPDLSHGAVQHQSRLTCRKVARGARRR